MSWEIHNSAQKLADIHRRYWLQWGGGYHTSGFFCIMSFNSYRSPLQKKNLLQNPFAINCDTNSQRVPPLSQWLLSFSDFYLNIEWMLVNWPSDGTEPRSMCLMIATTPFGGSQKNFFFFFLIHYIKILHNKKPFLKMVWTC